MLSSITIEQLISMTEKNKMKLIDVRSPAEYKEFSIPGSLNIPIFNDAERAEVGTLYKQVSIEAAKERGLEIVSAKLPAFIKEFQQVEGEKVVFCWRGGMRSKTAATLLDLMGIRVQRLEGGIRAYRKWVVGQFDQLKIPTKAYVLNGLTGAGKTKILKALQQEGYPVLDLEGMANHKGSIFGHIGSEPHNQKTFDSLLIHRLKQLENAPYLLFEAESNRIGKILVPPFLSELKRQSFHILIDMPIEERVQGIMEDYRPWEHQMECIEAFEHIKSRIHVPVAKQIESDLQTGDFCSAARLLLEYYYDDRYGHTELQYAENQKLILKVHNTEEAIKAVKNLLSELEKTSIRQFTL